MPPTQVSLEKGQWIDHQPVSSIADGGAITFLSSDTDDYLDLSRTILVVRAKVTKANGANLIADEKVGVVNNFLHSLFRKVNVFLKEKKLTPVMGISGNPPKLWSGSKAISTHCSSVLQRYGCKNKRCRSNTGWG